MAELFVILVIALIFTITAVKVKMSDERKRRLEELYSSGFKKTDSMEFGKHSILFDSGGRQLAIRRGLEFDLIGYDTIMTWKYNRLAYGPLLSKYALILTTSNVGKPLFVFNIEAPNPNIPELWMAKMSANLKSAAH